MSEKNNGNRQQLLVGIASGVVLLIICAVALFLRVYFPQNTVFRDGVTYFKENDPWYHVRLVENLVRHFPNRIAFDPYTYFPYGQNVPFAPLFDLFLGLAIWIIGLGKPALETIQTVSLYFPAVLGVLVVPPVYLIGKELFNRKVGLLAAGLVATMPNTFLARSLIGFTDHHVAEVLFSTITVLFLMLTLKSGTASGMTFEHVKRHDWKGVRKPLIYAALTGISLGMYLLAWLGGLLLVFMLFSAAVLMYVIDYLRGKSTDYLVITGAPAFFIALILILPFLGQLSFADLCVISLAACTFTFPALYLVSWFMGRNHLSRALYPFVLTLLGAVGAVGLYVIDRPLFLDILDKFRVFTPETGGLTISEVRPLFYSRGPFSWTPAWEEFTTGVFMAPVAFLVVIWNAVKKTSPEKWLFIVWCTVMTAATLGQIRFAYYLTVNVALLSGYFLWGAGTLIYRSADRVLLRNFRRRQQKFTLSERKPRRALRGKKQSVMEATPPPVILKKPRWPEYVSYVLIAVVIFSLVVYPNYQPAVAVASSFSGPPKDWYDALVWLRNNTPEPFGDPDFYYNYYEKPANGQNYAYPPSAYGVMSWWDYGHWITEIGRRIPNSNPFQAGAQSAGEFFIAQNEETANKMLNKLGSRYVIIDLEMAIPYRVSESVFQRGKYYAMAIWAGDSPEKYFDVFFRQKDGKWEQVPLYYPEYYQSMCARLYNFKGMEKVPQNSTIVISYAERNGAREILTEQMFTTYEEAKDFLSKQSGGNWRIVGKDPFVSPVPLKKLEHFQPVYHSDSWAAKFGENVIAYAVEIYSYTP